MLVARTAQRHLRETYRAPGFNIGMNIGACAGAGVAGHIHMHVLPRWPGDANFMTTVAETRVLPEDLRESWQKLTQAFSRG
jgi:ATP adenylyltransferase